MAPEGVAFRSLGVVYDPLRIRRSELEHLVTGLLDDLPALTEFPSRLVTIPIWYDDPWSRACAEAHGVGNNIDYLAEINGVSRDEVVAAHARVLHWVSAVGFQPSTFQAVPLGPMALTAPKYDPDEAHDLYVVSRAVGDGTELA